MFPVQSYEGTKKHFLASQQKIQAKTFLTSLKWSATGAATSKALGVSSLHLGHSRSLQAYWKSQLSLSNKILPSGLFFESSERVGVLIRRVQNVGSDGWKAEETIERPGAWFRQIKTTKKQLERFSEGFLVKLMGWMCRAWRSSVLARVACREPLKGPLGYRLLIWAKLVETERGQPPWAGSGCSKMTFAVRRIFSQSLGQIINLQHSIFDI